jgi:hypothetical protein
MARHKLGNCKCLGWTQKATIMPALTAGDAGTNDIELRI